MQVPVNKFAKSDKAELRMVCIPVEWCYAIKSGFFFSRNSSSLVIALREQSFLRKVKFSFAPHVMWCDLNAVLFLAADAIVRAAVD